MTLEAARLLMKDIVPAPSQPDSNVVELPTSQFPVVAVADVIICEVRICKGCGSVYTLTSSRVHRLLSNCKGDPLKKVLRPRKRDEAPLDRRVVKVSEVLSDHCTECWEDNCSVDEAWSIEPDRPPQTRVYSISGGNAGQAAARKDPKKVKQTINTMTAEQAAEFL